VLSPSTNDQIIESIDAPPQGIAMAPAELGEGRFRIDQRTMRSISGCRSAVCSFASPDAALPVSLLPSMVIARGEPRLMQLLNLVSDETRRSRPGRELVLERLLDVLLIEALRCGSDTAWPPSVARELSDNRLVAASRRACAAGLWLDGRQSCRRSRDVAFVLLPAVHPSSGCRRWNISSLGLCSCNAPIAPP
jgi:Cupin